jgi:hypothetical protein
VDLLELFEKSYQRLEQESVQYALCGGFAANLYRDENRFTGDVDYVLSSDDDEIKLSKSIITSFGLTPKALRLAELSQAPMMNKKQSPFVVVVGRDPDDKNAPGLDFLLSTNKWAETAIERAQHHRIEVEFGAVPVITREDVIIAKAIAANNKVRYKDLDDLQSILRSSEKIDYQYLCGQFDAHKLSLPRDLERNAPQALKVASKRNRRVLKI